MADFGLVPAFVSASMADKAAPSSDAAREENGDGRGGERRGEAGAGATGLAAGAAGAAPGVGVTPNRGRCSAGVAAPPADEPLPLFWAEPSGLLGNNVGG